MVVGTFVGAMSDKYGRRFMSIAFAVFYFVAGSCDIITGVLVPLRY